jgi:Concanavalin A-like lectin/glucanases superfamily
LIAWVESSLSSSSDTVFYMVYDNSAVTTWQSPAIPWDSNYLSVYHLPNGSSLSGTDSVGTATINAYGGPTATTGEIDGAVSINTLNAFMSTGTGNHPANGGFISNYDLSSKSFTVEFWTYLNSVTSTNQWFVETAISGNNTPLYTWWTNSGQFGLSGFIFGWYGSNGAYHDHQFAWSPSASTWYHVLCSYDQTNVIVYVNGSQIGGTITETTGPHSGNACLDLGLQNAQSASPYGFTGKLDEVRLSTNVARSSAWAVTAYNSEGSPGTFFTLGSEQNVGTSYFPNPSNLQGNLSTNLRGNL